MNNKVTKHLAKAAQANGICTPWLNELKSLDDKDALVDMYIRGIDFCLEHDYPSNDFIRENFKGVMEKHGVFLDDAIALQDQVHCAWNDKWQSHGNRIFGFGSMGKA